MLSKTMTDQEDPRISEYVEGALEASCAALMALQLVRARAADEEELNGEVTLAIASLRTGKSGLPRICPRQST
jgi:hypothetical protein